MPKYIQNMYGGTLGGPIKKDRLFFFTSWEGMKERRNFSRLTTVPTVLHRTGNFSDTTARIFEPMTGDPEGLGRTQFANATIPDSRISHISRKILALIPLPNLSGFTSNYYASAPGV